MIRIYGKATVSTWRPFEHGGGSQMRSAQRDSDDVTVLDQIVILQHHDGFWETYPLANCSIIWRGKPIVALLTEEDKETVLPISGRDHTLADEMATGLRSVRGPSLPMGSSDSAIDGSDGMLAVFPPERTYE